MLEAWGKFIERIQFDCNNVEQIWEQPLFLNPKIKNNNKVIYNKDLWDAGFRKIKDVVYELVPGFLRSQVFIDEVNKNGGEMTTDNAEKIMIKVKEGMPKLWKELIEKDVRRGRNNKVELYVGENERSMNITNLKTKSVYAYLSNKTIRRPAAEKVWEKLRPNLNIVKIWRNLRVKYNSIECENFDFLLRHNRIFNNLIISKFDRNKSNICDVCKNGVENFMHEFVECTELYGYFQKIKTVIYNCWKMEELEQMEWIDLWLFGHNGKNGKYNVNLLNYVLSHARYAVKLRRNMAHYEKRIIDVWKIFKGTFEGDVKAIYSHIQETDFQEGFEKGCTMVRRTENGKLIFDYG